MADRSRAARGTAAARTRAALAGALSLFAVAGCASDEPLPQRSCPRPVVVEDAANVTRFDGDGRDLTDVQFEASIEEIGLSCSIDDEENVILAELVLVVVAAQGPANADDRADLSYFVAVATRDQRILSRDAFDLSIPFAGNRTRVGAREELAPRIPIAPGQDGSDFRIYVGFELSPAELEYNRANR